MPRRLVATLAASFTVGLSLPAQSFQQIGPPLGLPPLPLTTGDFGTGMCLADFDGDGDVDIALGQPAGMPFLLFRNNGGMSFTDVSPGCGLGICGEVLCMAAADVDNDGDQDLYVGHNVAPVKLFINNGSGAFSEQAASRGLLHATQNYGVTFGDYNRDGWLDIYVGNRFATAVGGPPVPNMLYRNLGNGIFAPVPGAGGAAGNRPTFVVTFLDYNEDGWPDLLEVNDRGDSTGPNELYRNNGNGTFTPVAAQIGANQSIDGMGCDYTDVFCDGGVDFYCADLDPTHLFQLWVPALGSYVVATPWYGLQGGGIGWAVNWLDYDNDGWQDLHVVQMGFPNLLFRNPAHAAVALWPWADQAPALGLSHAYHKFTAAIADFDNDGRMDILQRYNTGNVLATAPWGASLHRNAVPGGNWLKFKTRGRISNADGLGTRIEVLTGSHRQRQWVRSGTGYISGSDRRLHFGLGSAAVADLVTITWPSGQVQYMTNVLSNQIVDVVEPRISLSAPALVGTTTNLHVSIPGDGGLPYLMMLSFAAGSTVFPDGKVLPVLVDDLVWYTLTPGNAVLPNSAGVLDAAGAAASALIVPPVPELVGLTLQGTAVTFDPPRFPWLRTVFARALPITLQ